jgi:hypothetical protein
MKPLTQEPAFFTAGETVTWEKCFDDYSPRDGWRLQYFLNGGAGKIELKAKTKDDYFEVKLGSNQTARFAPRVYWWQASVHKGSKSYIVGEGSIEVKPNLALIDSFDGRPHVKRVLDSLEATILGKASRDQLSYSIAGRSLSRLSPSELLEWRDVYKAEYNRMLRAEGLLRDQTIKVRFVQP